MCALCPPFFPNCEWPLDAAVTAQEQSCYYAENETIRGSVPFPSTQPQIQLERAVSFTVGNYHPTLIKKLSYNASDRDRGKKISTLYSSLRSLLPPADQKKRLSIPATVSRIVKYIPELQQQVERLIHEKEELVSRISWKQGADLIQRGKPRKKVDMSTIPAVSATSLGNREIVFQIFTQEMHKIPLSDILLNLEADDDLQLMNASSFESFGGRVQKSTNLDPEMLNKKLLSMKSKAAFS